MGFWHSVTHGLRTLLGRERYDQDLDDELQHYLAEAEAELIANGATPEEARRSVRLQHGDGLSAREDVRDFGWENTVESLWSDVRLAARRLRRSPGFAIIVVLTLGLGIGSATAIFSAASPVLLDSLPYPNADRILALSHRPAEQSIAPVAFGTYRELAARNPVFEALTVYKAWQPTVTGGQQPERLEAQRVSAQYFDVLGVLPLLGRNLDSAEDRPGGSNQVILSHSFWQRAFAADPAMLGRTVQLDAAPYTVVGVMPPDFINVPAPESEAWSLLQYDLLEPSFDSREWGHHLGMLGRLRPNFQLEQARPLLDEIASAPVPEFPRPDRASLDEGFTMRPFQEVATEAGRPSMLILSGAVALLLVIACVNLTVLFLGRSSRRRGELAMRAALGAGRGRLIRQLLTESLMLAVLGGALGIGLASLGLVGLISASPPTLPELRGIELDAGTLAFALGLTTLVGVLVGLGPALAPSGGRLLKGVRDANRTSVGRRPAHSALVVAEVALALMLLVGAGLVLRSTTALMSIPPGFTPTGVAVLKVYGTGLEPGDAVAHQFFDQALAAVDEVPGVNVAALTTQLPLSGDSEEYGVSLAGLASADPVASAYRYAATSDYFAVMGIRVLQGRALDRQDVPGAPPVVVISESLATRIAPDGSALGEQIHVGPLGEVPYTVVGVVANVKQTTLDAPRTNAVYITPSQWHWADRVRWIVVRSDQDPTALVPAIRQAVWSVDGNQPIVASQALETIVSRSDAQRSFVLLVLSSFAVLALILAGVGLYGVLAASVSERMREIGVRAALGASRENIVSLIVGQGLTLTVAGVLVGMAGAAAGGGLLRPMLYGVSRLDVTTYAVVALTLLGVGALACWVPAARAGRVDPL